MKMQPYKIILLFLLTTVLAACGGGGGGGGDGKEQGNVYITSAMRCANDVGYRSGYQSIPVHCEVVQIVDGSYLTDQSFIHLSGASFVAARDNCSDAELLVICIPLWPIGYGVSWNNMTNGASGSGSSGFGSLFGLSNIFWNTFSVKQTEFFQANPAGIPLEMGTNTIRVSAEDSARIGATEITVTRVVDVTPPTVHSVYPGPGTTTASYTSAPRVNFSEQLFPASVTFALQVTDENGQQISGTSEYDPLRLTIIWQPQANLNPGATYTVIVSGITDLVGNIMINPYDWTFTTRL